MQKKRATEKLIEEAYRILSEEKDGIFQSELWKKLETSSREGSRISKELEKRRLIVREKALYDGRWTYKLFLRAKPLEINMIEDIYCFQCEYESRCSADYPHYLKVCKYLEDWATRKYRMNVEERAGDASENRELG
ncbi:MAG: transcriptional regulator [Candidatus Geothermarchaeales archaeon]